MQTSANCPWIHNPASESPFFFFNHYQKLIVSSLHLRSHQRCHWCHHRFAMDFHVFINLDYTGLCMWVAVFVGLNSSWSEKYCSLLGKGKVSLDSFLMKMLLTFPFCPPTIQAPLLIWRWAPKEQTLFKNVYLVWKGYWWQSCQSKLIDKLYVWLKFTEKHMCVHCLLLLP